MVDGMNIGESFTGEGAEAAHVNTVAGFRNGPVGTAWATALATPSAGHAPFVAIVRPGLPAKPLTLFVNKAPIAGSRHGELTWGAAQAGVAAAG
jgi:5,6,7,8-tetrahydromethanopterin hydro-lyase